VQLSRFAGAAAGGVRGGCQPRGARAPRRHQRRAHDARRAELDEPFPPVAPYRGGISTTPMSEGLSVAVVIRFLESLKCPLDTRMLEPPAVREIVYRVPRGEQGG
jgi:AraC-type transcriptional regulator N-terminus